MDESYKETVLLLKYMISHNKSHIEELKELFARVKQYDSSLEKIFNDAVLDYENGTNKLETLLTKLTQKEEA